MKLQVPTLLLLGTFGPGAVGSLGGNESGGLCGFHYHSTVLAAFPLGGAKTGGSQSGAARPSLPAGPRETCARSWAPSSESTGSAALEAPRSSPQTSGCRSRGDRCSHPPAAPSLRSARKTERRWMERRQEKEEVKETEDSLRRETPGMWGSLRKACPRWSAPCRGGNNTPVHFLGQHAPPIRSDPGRKESAKEESWKCFGGAALRSRTQPTGKRHPPPATKQKKKLLLQPKQAQQTDGTNVHQ